MPNLLDWQIMYYCWPNGDWYVPSPNVPDKIDTIPIQVDKRLTISLGEIFQIGLKDVFVKILNVWTDVNATTHKTETLPNPNRFLPAFNYFCYFCVCVWGGVSLSAVMNTIDTAGRHCPYLEWVMILDNDVTVPQVKTGGDPPFWLVTVACRIN